MTENPVRCLLKTFLISGAEERVQQDVVRLERRIGFEFAAPIPFFVLLREEKLPRSCDRSPNAAGEFLNFAEAEQWVRTERWRIYVRIGGVVIHQFTAP